MTTTTTGAFQANDINSSNEENVQNQPEKNAPQVYKSYLPDHTVPGLVLPRFNFQSSSKSHANTTTTTVASTTTTSTTTTSGQSNSVGPGVLQRTRAAKSAPELYLHEYSLNRIDSTSDSVWQVNIYKYGRYTEPSRDRLLQNFKWTKGKNSCMQDDWMNLTFTKKEICTIIADIFNLWEDKSVSEEEVSRWIAVSQEQDMEQIFS
jgi:hypothetical protein